LSGIKAMHHIWNTFIERDSCNTDSFRILNWIQLFHNKSINDYEIEVGLYLKYWRTFFSVSDHLQVSKLWKLSLAWILFRQTVFSLCRQDRQITPKQKEGKRATFLPRSSRCFYFLIKNIFIRKIISLA
jgi:hypothetical protein